MTEQEALMLAQAGIDGSETLLIDADTRSIYIPESEKFFGVESDQNVERKKFKCPKIVGDNIDLSTLHLYINYQNGNGNKDSYMIQDMAVSGDYITFSWVLSRNVSAYKGNVRFIFCAKKADNSGNLVNEWNTTLAEGTVLEGLEATDEVVARNPDIIEQILTRLDNVSEIPQEKVTEAVDQYMTANPISVPEKLSDLQDDSEHRTVTDTEKQLWNNKSDFSGNYEDLTGKPIIPTVPTTLPNPNALTITYGGQSYEYDGSEAIAITIETGGIERIEKLSTDTTVTLEPNKLYIFPEMENLTYTIGEGTGEVHFIFRSGATATRVVHPSNVNIGSFSVESNKVYEVSILEGLLTSQNWSVSDGT